MPRLWDEMSHDIAYRACEKLLENKWSRNDVRGFIEEWTGYSRFELMEAEHRNGNGLPFGTKYTILEELAMMVEDMVDGIMHGIDPDFDPVTSSMRRDGNTGKIRNIATLCYRHQALGHVVKIGMEKLLAARILPTQHASIPEQGQIALARQVRRYLGSRKLGITRAVKTDCTGAYASVLYGLVIRILRKEIPRAKWIIRCMEELEKAAPGGHLIIGGYIDAWLFNFVMSYAMRHMMQLTKSRRGETRTLVVRAVGYMDDVTLLGRSRKDLREAIRESGAWMRERLRMTLRQTSSIFRLCTTAEEKERKHRKGARHGCPAVDMGGYLIHRTYITVRKRNLPKIMRAFERSRKDLEEYRTLRRQRAGQVVSRYGQIKSADSRAFMEKHDVYQIMRKARKNQGYWSREEAKRRRERIENAIQRHAVNVQTLCCYG